MQQREEIKSISPKSGKAGKTKLLALSLLPCRTEKPAAAAQGSSPPASPSSPASQPHKVNFLFLPDDDDDDDELANQTQELGTNHGPDQLTGHS